MTHPLPLPGQPTFTFATLIYSPSHSNDQPVRRKKMPVGIITPTCPLPIYCPNLFPNSFTFLSTLYLFYFSHLLYFYYSYLYFYLFIFIPHLHHIHFIFMQHYILCMSNHLQVPMEMQSHWTSTLQHIVHTSVKAQHPIFILSYLKMRMHFHLHIPIGIGIR